MRTAQNITPPDRGAESLRDRTHKFNAVGTIERLEALDSKQYATLVKTLQALDPSERKELMQALRAKFATLVHAATKQGSGAIDIDWESKTPMRLLRAMHVLATDPSVRGEAAPLLPVLCNVLGNDARAQVDPQLANSLMRAMQGFQPKGAWTDPRALHAVAELAGKPAGAIQEAARSFATEVLQSSRAQFSPLLAQTVDLAISNKFPAESVKALFETVRSEQLTPDALRTIANIAALAGEQHPSARLSGPALALLERNREKILEMLPEAIAHGRSGKLNGRSLVALLKAVEPVATREALAPSLPELRALFHSKFTGRPGDASRIQEAIVLSGRLLARGGSGSLDSLPTMIERVHKRLPDSKLREMNMEPIIDLVIATAKDKPQATALAPHVQQLGRLIAMELQGPEERLKAFREATAQLIVQAGKEAASIVPHLVEALRNGHLSPKELRDIHAGIGREGRLALMRELVDLPLDDRGTATEKALIYVASFGTRRDMAELGDLVRGKPAWVQEREASVLERAEAHLAYAVSQLAPDDLRQVVRDPQRVRYQTALLRGIGDRSADLDTHGEVIRAFVENDLPAGMTREETARALALRAEAAEALMRMSFNANPFRDRDGIYREAAVEAEVERLKIAERRAEPWRESLGEPEIDPELDRKVRAARALERSETFERPRGSESATTIDGSSATAHSVLGELKSDLKLPPKDRERRFDRYVEVLAGEQGNSTDAKDIRRHALALVERIHNGETRLIGALMRLPEDMHGGDTEKRLAAACAQILTSDGIETLASALETERNPVVRHRALLILASVPNPDKDDDLGQIRVLQARALEEGIVVALREDRFESGSAVHVTRNRIQRAALAALGAVSGDLDGANQHLLPVATERISDELHPYSQAGLWFRREEAYSAMAKIARREARELEA